MNEDEFRTAFGHLAGTPGHFPWQWELYRRMVNGETPRACDLPTGLGKTSVIHVWLLALAANPKTVPRRLVYVVNRRTVVDQTTAEVENLRARLPGVPNIEAALWGLCSLPPVSPDPERDRPLAVSTLRGQFADNREWSADPARPAVICGTVDMIGSRLLFAGYGCGFKTRPLHAGFLGQDALVVHDEAHLEPAFQKLLLAIEEEQQKRGDFCRLKVMELTATSRAGGDAFGLTDSDRGNETVQARIHARKLLHLHAMSSAEKSADDLAARALGFKDSGAAVLVFTRTVEDVTKIAGALDKQKQKVQRLTGTLRGLERDRMADPRRADGCPIFARFLPPPRADAPAAERWVIEPHPGTVYLVCTSAGEVGVNISADHLVCDLSTFESMAQRFGRVNRFGRRHNTEVHVIHPSEADFDDANEVDVRRRCTLALLRELPPIVPFSPGVMFDASPAALGGLDAAARQAAFAPEPTILPTSDILFDAWALTSVRERLPGRAPVEPYLHGLSEWEPAETQVAWREEVERITGPLLTLYPPEDLLEDYPLKPHELLHDTSTRVFDRLKKLSAGAETPVWVVDDDGSVHPTTLGKLRDGGRELIERCTVLLPPTAGGLANGMLDSASGDANDVTDQWFADPARTQPRRWRRVGNDTPPAGMRRVRKPIDLDPDADEDGDEDAAGKRFWHWYELPAGGDGDGSKAATRRVLWQTHTDDVVRNTAAIAANLVPGALANVFAMAAECHDLGKRRQVFQTVLGNREYPSVLLAKSGQRGGRVAEVYRHEFGSLLDTASAEHNRAFERYDALKAVEKDLVLHLIAAHHGRGRPHFPAAEAFDPERPHAAADDVARAVPRRFAQLQRRYGRWGLAYLESLLRAADYAASANPSPDAAEGKK